MKRLHKFIITSFIGPLALTFFIVMFLLLMQFLWKYIDDLVGKGLEPPVILELLLYTSAGLVPMALPLGILLASIMTFGNLGENYELTALKSAGISLQRIMYPLMILVIIISIAAFFFSNHVIPFTNLKSGALMYDVQRQRPELQIKESQFYNGIEGYSIRIADKDKRTNLLKKVMIYDHKEKNGNLKVTVADSGYMNITPDEKNLVLTLYNGYSYEEVKKKKRQKNKTHPHRRNKFEKQIITIELIGFGLARTDEALFKNNYQMLNLGQLENAIDSLSNLHLQDRSNFTKTILSNNLFKKVPRRKKLDSTGFVPPKPNKTKIRPDTKNHVIKDSLNLKKEKSFGGKFKKNPNINDSSKLIGSNNIKKNNTNKPENKDKNSLLVDSLFSNLKIKNKKNAIRYTLNFAHTTQNHITTNQQFLLSRRKLINKHYVAWHRKFALSFACFIFFFIGAPLGAIIRKGGLGMPVVISVLFFIVYYVISLTGEKFAKESIWPPAQGMWLSSFILLPLGIFLTYKAATDSTLMNSDAYLIFFKNLFKKKKAT